MSREDQQRTSDMSQTEVSLGVLLRALRQQVKVTLEINLPATVVSYNPLTEKAVVTIGWLEIVRDLQSPLANAELPLPPKIITCRVAWVDNGAGDGSRLPIMPATTGSVRVFDRNLATWLAAPPGTPVDPLMSFTHMLSDSTFSPDLRPDTVPLTPVAGPALAAHLIRAATLLMLGGDFAVEGVTKALSLQIFMVAAATAASAASVPGDGGAAAFTSFAGSLAALNASAGSTKVLTE